jgi:hypothetical protein
VELSEGGRQRRCIGGEFHILNLNCIDKQVLTLRVWEDARRGECESGSMPSIDRRYCNVEFTADSFIESKSRVVEEDISLLLTGQQPAVVTRVA